ncbi:MAG: hypothetical protein RSB91_03805 [Clostridia bacterium]
MQTKATKKPKVEEVKKPVLTGSWHGIDAWKLAGKRALSVLAVSVLYLITGMLLSFDNLIMRVLCCAAVVGLAVYYQYYQGMVLGQSDASFAEIMYAREQDGRQVTKQDRDRCFHPMKGFFAAMVGAVPFVLFAIAFAMITKPIVYTLGVLPSWTEGMLRQNEFGDALRYYQQGAGMSALDVMRILDRAMVMPFINVAAYLGDSQTLLVERLSPLLVLIAPLGYGCGYCQGLKLRIKINTGIKMGDDKKKRKERKARKQRQRSSAPERLI